MDETAPSYVERESPTSHRHPKGAGRRWAAGARTSDPARDCDAAAEESFIRELRDAGLRGIEVFHSDHRPADMERYAGIARKLNLLVTGGSDFHGANKRNISLGTGQGNLNIPMSVLNDLRACA